MTIRMKNLELLALTEMKEFVTANRPSWLVSAGASVGVRTDERVLKGAAVPPIELISGLGKCSGSRCAMPQGTPA